MTTEERPADAVAEPGRGTDGGGWMRAAIGVIVFLLVTAAGIVAFGQFGEGEVDPNTGANATAANSFALILAIAMLVGTAVTLLLERVQTGHFGSLSRQFTLRVVVLMPFAIAINIVLGQTVAAALKIPIYLDSIGTILVGVLAGPIAGAATGALGNLLWAYVVPPPFQYPPAAAFAVVAAGHRHRGRPRRPLRRAAAADRAAHRPAHRGRHPRRRDHHRPGVAGGGRLRPDLRHRAQPAAVERQPAVPGPGLRGRPAGGGRRARHCSHCCSGAAT